MEQTATEEQEMLRSASFEVDNLEVETVEDGAREEVVEKEDETEEESVSEDKEQVAGSKRSFFRISAVMKKLMMQYSDMGKVDIIVKLLMAKNFKWEKLGVRISHEDGKAHLDRCLSGFSPYQL